MLWNPTNHERLTDAEWNEGKIVSAVNDIGSHAEIAFHDEKLWRPHPRDDLRPGAYKSLYIGASGVIWGLEQLARAEATALDKDWTSISTRLVELYVADPDGGDEIGGSVPSFWIGETGVLLNAHRAAPERSYADRIALAIGGNIENPARELMWGSPGTMLAAHYMFERTADQRWADLWRASARWLWDDWRGDTWEQDLYGRRVHVLGPAHGFVGNISVLARGDLLDSHRRSELERRAVQVIASLALREGQFAQWPATIESRSAHSDELRTQWCHGAPGIVASLAGVAENDDELTDILIAGGELTWAAGPLAKGAGLCHGTAGNGYAFLKLFVRTSDERWLQRARRFAMHAVEQVERARREFGGGRNTLLTGDVGTALFLLACRDADASVPTLDYF